MMVAVWLPKRLSSLSLELARVYIVSIVYNIIINTLTYNIIVTLRTVSLSVASIEPCNYNTCNWQES